MEHQISVLVASIGFSLWFITFANIPQKWNIAFKPFNCEVCFPIYVTVVLLFCPTIVSEVLAICSWSAIATAYIAHRLND